MFFIGTEDGLFLFRQKEKTIHKLEAFGSKCIYSFSRDREGGVWVGTYFDGVYYISPQSNYIKWYYEKHKQNSLSGNAVSQFSEDSEGNLWIATENGGLNYFNPRTEEFYTLYGKWFFYKCQPIIIYMLYYWTIISYG